MAHYFRSTGTAWGTLGDWSTTPSPTYTAPAAIPTAADDVIFESVSAACNLGTATRLCKSITVNSAYNKTFSGSAALTVSGSITWGSSMNYTHTGLVTVNATGTYTSNGKTINNLTVTGSGNTFTIGDNSAVSGTVIVQTSAVIGTTSFKITCANLTLGNCTLNADAFTVTNAAATATAAGLTITLGSDVTLDALFTINSTNTVNLNSGSATLRNLNLKGGLTCFNAITITTAVATPVKILINGSSTQNITLGNKNTSTTTSLNIPVTINSSGNVVFKDNSRFAVGLFGGVNFTATYYHLEFLTSNVTFENTTYGVMTRFQIIATSPSYVWPKVYCNSGVKFDEIEIGNKVEIAGAALRARKTTCFRTTVTGGNVFTGSYGFEIDEIYVNTSGTGGFLTLTLEAGIEYIINNVMNLQGVSTAARFNLVSSSTGTYTKLTLKSNASQNNIYVATSWIDSRNGQTVFATGSTFTSTLNWNIFPYIPPFIY
jgi:hypothetical protein